MAEYKTPGVYIEEIPHLPPSIASVETAIPAFIGYTETAPTEIENGSFLPKPQLVSSIFGYEALYCNTDNSGYNEPLQVTIDMADPSNPVTTVAQANSKLMPSYMMHYQLQMFFSNGGGPCYIVSVGNYTMPVLKGSDAANGNDLLTGLREAAKINDVTLLVFPDAMLLSESDYYGVQAEAINQCVTLQNRFAVMDVWMPNTAPNPGDAPIPHIDNFRNAAGFPVDEDHLKYAGIYYPRLYTSIQYSYNDSSVKLTVKNAPGFNAVALGDVKTSNKLYYNLVKSAISDSSITRMLLPASGGVLGIYAATDSSRGVWKAPANVQITNALKPELQITNQDQETINVDANAGKSVNAIRTFPGRGSAIIWGARTLAGNSNEWRYISVRRFFIMVEQSVKNASEQFVFEPNDENTWIRIKSMITNYLTQQWKAGALMGSTPAEAFFVHIGLGQTMTELDIWEGRLIIQIGMAAVRPAEFIILQFMHKMLSES